MCTTLILTLREDDEESVAASNASVNLIAAKGKHSWHTEEKVRNTRDKLQQLLQTCPHDMFYIIIHLAELSELMHSYDTQKNGEEYTTGVVNLVYRVS